MVSPNSISESAPSSKILIVDDDTTSLYALSESLQSSFKSAQIVTCPSAIAALRQIEMTDFDVIITDVRMPGMNGLQLLDTIQAMRTDIPILLVTGYEDYHVAVQALRSGAYDLIQKPIDWDYFMASLSSAIQTRQVSRMTQIALLQDRWSNAETLLRGVKVLIVEDNPDERDMHHMVLQAYGATVQTVASARAALEILEQFNPSILVSNLRMPQEEGYSLIHQVRQRSAVRGGEVPAVALSAYVTEDRSRALKAGFQLQLVKPIKPITLALTLMTLVRDSRTAR